MECSRAGGFAPCTKLIHVVSAPACPCPPQLTSTCVVGLRVYLSPNVTSSVRPFHNRHPLSYCDEVGEPYQHDVSPSYQSIPSAVHALALHLHTARTAGVLTTAVVIFFPHDSDVWGRGGSVCQCISWTIAAPPMS